MTRKPPASTADKQNVIHLTQGYPVATENSSDSSILENLLIHAADLAKFEWGATPAPVEEPQFTTSSLASLGTDKNLKILTARDDKSSSENEDASKVAAFKSPDGTPALPKKVGGNR